MVSEELELSLKILFKIGSFRNTRIGRANFVILSLGFDIQRECQRALVSRIGMELALRTALIMISHFC